MIQDLSEYFLLLCRLKYKKKVNTERNIKNFIKLPDNFSKSHSTKTLLQNLLEFHIKGLLWEESSDNPNQTRNYQNITKYIRYF